MKRFSLKFLWSALVSLLALCAPLRADTLLTPIGLVDQGPAALVVNPITNQIFVANLAGASVSILDGQFESESIQVQASVSYLAVNAAANKLYAVNPEGNSVAIIDGATGNKTNLTVGNSPQAIALNPITNTVYVANAAAGSVSVIDGNTDAVVTTITGLESPDGIAVNPLTNQIYVANFGNGTTAGTVTVIDGATNTPTSVPVGVGPTAIAVNPAANKIYVVNTFGDDVTVIDGATNATTTVPVGNSPNAVAVNPATNDVYVTNQGAGTLTVIDGATVGSSFPATSLIAIGASADALSINPAANKIYVVDAADGNLVVVNGATGATSTLAVGAQPAAVAANPITNRIYVAVTGSNQVAVIDGSDNTTATFSTGFYPYDVVVNPLTNRAYVTDLNQNEVTVIDGNTQATTTVAAGSGPYGIDVNPGTNQVYVADFNGTTVTVIDGFTNNTTAVTVGTHPIAVAVNPVTNQIYTADFNGFSSTVIDGATLNTITVAAGTNPIAVAVNPVTNQIYVANYASDNVTVIDGATNDTTTIPFIVNPNSLAVNTVTNQIFVASQTSNNVAIIDGATNTIITSPSVGNTPTAVAINEVTNQIYVANQGSSTVTVIDGYSYTTTTVPVGSSPDGLVVNPATNEIYVANGSGNSVTVIDGVRKTTTTVPAGASPFRVGLNPVTGQIYVPNTGSETVTVINPVSSGSSGLITAIAPLPGDQAQTNTLLGLGAIDLYGPNAPPIQQVYYQFDTAMGPWIPVSSPGSGGVASLAGLTVGSHVIYAFATDGEESTSTTSGFGLSAIPGRVAASSFIITAAPIPPTFSFQQATATAYNTDPAVTVTVQRNFTEAATVGYQALSGSAVEGLNFQATSGTLSFLQGQMTTTISVPLLGQALSASEAYFVIELLNPSNSATIVSPGSVDVFLLNASTPDLSLSNFAALQPAPAPAAAGSLTVGLSPAAADGQWRLFGELAWRNSGDIASGLVAADYEVEFKPVSGYQQPATLVVSITGNQALVSGTYIATNTVAVGSLTVALSPQNTGGWRLQGQSDFLAGGGTVTGLNAGSYIVEFEPVAGLATPESCEVIVQPNNLSSLSIAYLIADSTTGATPSLVDNFSSLDPRVNPSVSYTGQLQTDDGLGTGFVPLDRVVVTAVHVLFDDASLSYVTGIRWFFQHETGSFEAPPQIPRGFYALDGYAAQRAIDNSPGVSSTASQQLDVAAIYFLEPAARGGQSGYLASDSSSNPWLTNSSGATARDKFIAGYPADGVDPATVGRLYATPIVQNAFTFASGSLFDTTALTSYHGNSGGPLFVGYTDPTNGETFYPAAIYLGGAAQTVVRAIDGQVVDLMNRAETSGNGGVVNAGNGVIEIDAGLTGNLQSAYGGVDVILQPAGAVSAGALWSLPSDSTGRQSGAAALNVVPGSYQITFSNAPGYTAPAPMTVTVAVGQTAMATAAYTPLAPVITSGGSATSLVGQPFSFQVTASPAPISFSTTSMLPTGLSLDPTTGLLSGTPTETGVFVIALTASNAGGPGPASTLNLTVATAGELFVTANGSGTVTKGFTPSTIQAVGSTVAILATPVHGAIFLNWTATDATGVTTVVWHHPNYVFEMPSFLNLQANFIANPFTAVAGAYNGLLLGPADALGSRGSVSLSVTNTGAFTGTLYIGNQRYALRGAFDATGAFSGLLPGSRTQPSVVVTLALDLSGGTQGLTGQALAGSVTFHLGAYRTPFTAASPAPQALGLKAGAKYVLALPHPADAGLPQGDGYGTLTVSPVGAVRFTGVLGDGTVVSESSSLGPAGQWPFFLLLYSNGGALTGQLKIAAPAGDSAISGSLDWFKPTDKTPYYPSAFTTNVTVQGEALGATPLTGLTQETLTLGQGGLGQGVGPFAVNFDAKGNGTVVGVSAFALKINASTGLFTGKFPDAANKSHFFNGVYLPPVGASPAAGFGLFLGLGKQTGAVEF